MRALIKNLFKIVLNYYNLNSLVFSYLYSMTHYQLTQYKELVLGIESNTLLTQERQPSHHTPAAIRFTPQNGYVTHTSSGPFHTLVV